MTKLVSCKYIPKEILYILKNERNIEEYERKGYTVLNISTNLYSVTKPPKLEMIFQEGDEDFIFDMADEVKKYFKGLCKENEISDTKVDTFVSLITKGKIKISISSNGTYTLNEE